MCISQKTPACLVPAQTKLPEQALMLNYKVDMCPKSYRHDWSSCPFAHKGELSSRRSPNQHLPILCRNSVHSTDLKEKCPLGDNCPYAHNHFEYWLHPGRFRTSMCRNATSCKRSICFFAHNEAELRTTIYSCSMEEADTPAAASEHIVAAAAAEAAGLTCADDVCPNCITRQLLAIQQCIDGDQLVERMQEVVNPIAHKDSTTICSNDSSTNCCDAASMASDSTTAQPSNSANISSPAASSCESPASKSLVCSICLGPMFDPSQVPRCTAAVAKAGSHLTPSCDTLYAGLDQHAAAAAAGHGGVDGTWEGLPLYLQQLLAASTTPAAVPAPGGWDSCMSAGLVDPVGFEPWGTHSETQGSLLAAFGWAGAGANDVQGGQGLAGGYATMEPVEDPMGAAPALLGHHEFLLQQSSCSKELWTGLLDGTAAVPGPVGRVSTVQQGFGLQGLGLAPCSAPPPPPGALYSTMSLSPASSNVVGNTPRHGGRGGPPARTSSGSGGSNGSPAPGPALENMGDLQAVLSMLSVGSPAYAVKQQPHQQQPLLPSVAGMGRMAGTPGTAMQQQARGAPYKIRSQQLLEHQMALGPLGWAQQPQTRVASTAAGLGMMLEGGVGAGQGGWAVDSQGQEQVLQWLVQQQQAGAGLRDGSWWGAAGELAMGRLY